MQSLFLGFSCVCVCARTVRLISQFKLKKKKNLKKNTNTPSWSRTWLKLFFCWISSCQGANKKSNKNRRERKSKRKKTECIFYIILLIYRLHTSLIKCKSYSVIFFFFSFVLVLYINPVDWLQQVSIGDERFCILAKHLLRNLPN